MPEIPDRMNSVDAAIMNAVYSTSSKLWRLMDKMIPLLRSINCSCETISAEGQVPTVHYTCARCEALEEYGDICSPPQ